MNQYFVQDEQIKKQVENLKYTIYYKEILQLNYPAICIESVQALVH